MVDRLLTGAAMRWHYIFVVALLLIGPAQARLVNIKFIIIYTVHIFINIEMDKILKWNWQLELKYTPQIKFLLALSFANFENWGVTFFGQCSWDLGFLSTPSGRFKICKWKSEEKHFLGSVFELHQIACRKMWTGLPKRY